VGGGPDHVRNGTFSAGKWRESLHVERQPATGCSPIRHATGRDSAPRPSAVVDLRPSSPNQHTTTTTAAAASQHSLPPARTMNDPTQQREGHMERRGAGLPCAVRTQRGPARTVRCVQPSRPTFPGSDHDAATPGCRHISRSAAGAAAPAPGLLPHRRAPFAAHSRATAQSLPSSTQHKHTHHRRRACHPDRHHSPDRNKAMWHVKLDPD
jgi:hypothetical protein